MADVFANMADLARAGGVAAYYSRGAVAFVMMDPWQQATAGTAMLVIPGLLAGSALLAITGQKGAGSLLWSSIIATGIALAVAGPPIISAYSK